MKKLMYYKLGLAHHATMHPMLCNSDSGSEIRPGSPISGPEALLLNIECYKLGHAHHVTMYKKLYCTHIEVRGR